MEPREIPGGKGRLTMRPDGVLYLQWNEQVVIDEPDAKAAMATVNEMCGDTTHPMLVDMAKTKSVTRSGRAVFSIPCAASRIALLGSSAVDRLLANFFLGVYTPPCPTRFFNSRSEAMEWLLIGMEADEDTGRSDARRRDAS